MASNRDKLGRFKKGTHWRPHKAFREKAYLLAEYVKKQRSAADIATEWKVTENAIYFWLDKLGVPRRTIAQSRAAKHWGPRGTANPMFGRFGKDNPNYKHGNTPERQRSYSRYFWKQLVAVIHERDGHKCVRCGCGQPLGTHHLKSWTRHPEARYDAAQIVTICKACHNWIHSKRNAKREYLSS